MDETRRLAAVKALREKAAQVYSEAAEEEERCGHRALYVQCMYWRSDTLDDVANALEAEPLSAAEVLAYREARGEKA